MIPISYWKTVPVNSRQRFPELNRRTFKFIAQNMRIRSQAVGRKFGIALAIGAVHAVYSEASITSGDTDSGSDFPFCGDSVCAAFPFKPGGHDPTVPVICVQRQPSPLDAASRQSDGLHNQVRSHILDYNIISHVMAADSFNSVIVQKDIAEITYPVNIIFRCPIYDDRPSEPRANTYVSLDNSDIDFTFWIF
jgi:hypothetical protein